MSLMIFYVLSSLTILSALMVIASKRAMYSILWLVVTFFTISGHYILMNAQFLALVNIVVYAGAIMVLFLFVVMMLNQNKEAEGRIPFFSRLIAVVSGGAFFLVLIAGLKTSTITGQTAASGTDNSIGLVENLGKVLYQQYLIPFELSSVLFLVAMIGAIILGKEEPRKKLFPQSK